MSNIRFTHRHTGAPANKFARLLLAIPAVGMVLFFPPSAQAAIPQQERDALIALFNNLGGINWTNKTGWLGLPGTECNWYGVTCDPAQVSVTGLNLSGNGLGGSIPVEIGRLAGLQTLNLNDASVWSIPDEIGNLTNLQVLELGGTSIFFIPSALGNLSQLQILFISSYWLGGSIPIELGNLKNLLSLELGSNELSGNIPSSLGNLTQLSHLDLEGNKLSGSIPLSLSNLTCHIWIGYNALFTDDYGLVNFLGSAAWGWDKTQTVAPSNAFAVFQSDSSTLVSWQPIPFTDYEGRYEVWMSRASGGPYELAGSTADKKSSSILLHGLTPGTYLILRTVTDPNDRNQNTVVSDFSAEISVSLPITSLSLSLNHGGAAFSSTFGSTGATKAGYAAVTLNQGSAPYATAVFSHRQNGVIVSEAGIPVSPPTRSVRLFVDYRTDTTIPGSDGRVDVYSGIAVVNCGDGPASIAFTLRGGDGQIITSGIGSLAKAAHLAKFIHQLPDILPGFSIPSSFSTSTRFGTLEVTSDRPLSVVALRLTINQRGETLLTTTPVADLTRPSTASSLYFPQLADGGGYTTSLILMNTSSSIETGRLNIFADDGSALPVRQLNGISGSSFPYLILPGAAYVFQTDASPAVVKTGWVELTPGGGTPAPAAAGIFQYSRNGILLTESGIPPANPTTHARVFVDLSGGHDTGLALCNPGYTRLDVSLTAFQMDGVNQVGKNEWPVSLRGRGHIAAFADQLISYLPADFQGVLDIASDSPFAALTLRSLVNERFDFLLTTFPVADVNKPAPFPIIFPQIADGGGYRTEFILISAGQSSSATVGFFDDEGAPLAIGH